MRTFYLQPINTTDKFYELHATTQVHVSFTSSVTTYPVETGSEVADNVVMGSAIVSFTGILTEVSQSPGLGSPISLLSNLISGDEDGTPADLPTYIKDLRTLQFAKTVFDVFFAEAESGIEGVENAILTQFDLNKSVENGTSWEVTVSLQEVRFADRAALVNSPDADWVDLLKPKSEDSATSGSVTPTQEQRIRGLNLEETGGNQLKYKGLADV